MSAAPPTLSAKSHEAGSNDDALLRLVVADDPLGFAGDDVNLYRYAGNNPLTNTDPTGLQREYAGVAGGVSSFGGISLAVPPWLDLNGGLGVTSSTTPSWVSVATGLAITPSWPVGSSLLVGSGGRGGTDYASSWSNAGSGSIVTAPTAVSTSPDKAATIASNSSVSVPITIPNAPTWNIANVVSSVQANYPRDQWGQGLINAGETARQLGITIPTKEYQAAADALTTNRQMLDSWSATIRNPDPRATPTDRMLQHIESPENKSRLLKVVTAANQAWTLPILGNQCYRWTNDARERIVELGQDYYRNSDFEIVHADWNLPPNSGDWQNHSALAVRFKDGFTAYLDNGVLTDGKGHESFAIPKVWKPGANTGKPLEQRLDESVIHASDVWANLRQNTIGRLGF